VTTRAAFFCLHESYRQIYREGIEKDADTLKLLYLQCLSTFPIGIFPSQPGGDKFDPVERRVLSRPVIRESLAPLVENPRAQIQRAPLLPIQPQARPPQQLNEPHLLKTQVLIGYPLGAR